MMNQAQYRKRLEEILDKQFKRLDGTVELPIYNRPTAIDQALQAILSLNEEAIGEDYLPHCLNNIENYGSYCNNCVACARKHDHEFDAGYEYKTDKLRTIIGKGK